ncbi:hypothetical protein C8J57DRAFT_1719632 [Mycena rebaudengoi]|nr:hypothetical protein C8J57DRAFT_1719632 [Mycena rebaudengoi]
MPVLSTVKSVSTKAGACLALLVCAPCFHRQREPDWRCGGWLQIRILDPHPLPTDRIDIGQTQIEPQAEACRLLSLLIELRQLIFETALVRRVLSQYLGEDPAHGYQRYRVRAHRDSALPVALLRTCRQVYLEALPIFRQRNTFHFDLRSAPSIILGGLGLFSLPDIRSVELMVCGHNSDSDTQFSATCRLLEMAGLESFALTFVPNYHFDRRDFGMESDWCRSLLKIRGLRRLVLHCEFPSPAGRVEQEADEFKLTRRKEKVRKAMMELRALMIGPEADTRYTSFLEAQKLRDREKAGKEVK